MDHLYVQGGPFLSQCRELCVGLLACESGRVVFLWLCGKRVVGKEDCVERVVWECERRVVLRGL